MTRVFVDGLSHAIVVNKQTTYFRYDKQYGQLSLSIVNDYEFIMNIV